MTAAHPRLAVGGAFDCPEPAACLRRDRGGVVTAAGARLSFTGVLGCMRPIARRWRGLLAVNGVES